MIAMIGVMALLSSLKWEAHNAGLEPVSDWVKMQILKQLSNRKQGTRTTGEMVLLLKAFIQI